jgi:hypothetical protein
MDELWSEWIEHKPGACPIPWAQAKEYEVKWFDGSLSVLPAQWDASRLWDSADDHDHFKYRYLLSAAPAGFVPPGEKPWVPPQLPGYGPWVVGMPTAMPVNGHPVKVKINSSGTFHCVALEDQPTAAEVEATQVPETTESAAADRTADEANRLMLERDGKPESKPAVTPAPGFMLEGFRSVEPNLLVVAQFCHRMGRL